MFGTGNTGFGTATTSTGVAFNFGQPAKTSSGFSFGQTTATTSAATGFGGFGTGFGTTTTTTSSAFNFGNLGAKTTASTGFGTTTTTSSGFGGFGAFGSTTKSVFGGGLTTTTSSGFGFSLTQPTSSSATGLGGLSNLNVANQANQQQGATDWTSIATAVSVPVLFGDERDSVVARWNQLQAFWGTGKGFFNSQGNFASFAADNPFCRFKTVGYSLMPSSRNEDGLVALIFNKTLDEVRNNQTALTDALQKLLGAPQNCTLCVDCVKELPENKCEMQLYLLVRPAQGSARRISATDLANHLSQNHISSQLQSQMAVERLLPKTGLTKEQLKQYLDTPPMGIDPFLWDQAKLDNPDPEQFVPVPMVGFKELYNRLKLQESQTKVQQAKLDMISNNIRKLQQDQVNVVARIEEYKRNQLELSHRVLRVMARQEVTRKLGFGIQAEEEQLRVHLEALQAALNAPTQFKGRLNELMSQLRMQNQLDLASSETGTQLDSFAQQQISKHLKQQQEGLHHLISIIKEDMSHLGTIETGLKELK